MVLVVEAARRRNAFWRGLGVMVIVIGIGVVLTVWICVAGMNLIWGPISGTFGDQKRSGFGTIGRKRRPKIHVGETV